MLVLALAFPCLASVITLTGVIRAVQQSLFSFFILAPSFPDEPTTLKRANLCRRPGSVRSTEWNGGEVGNEYGRGYKGWCR